MEKKMVVDYAHEKWEKKFGTDAAYEKWDKKNKSKGTDNYFDTESRAKKSYLKGLKGRVQNNLSGLLRVVVTALIVLLQILLILILPFLLRSITVYFYFILELCSIIAIVTLVNKKQSPSFRIAWISIVLLLPISGFVLYYLWGREGGKKKQLDEHILRQISYGQNFLIQDGKIAEEYVEKHPVAGRMVKYMISEGFPLTAGNDVKYYPMGEDAFEDIIEALEQAKEYIFIDFFIVAEGALWDQIHKILKRKLEEGVEVKFLYDDFGAAIRTQKFFKQILEHEGMEVRVFNPIHKYTGELYMNYFYPDVYQKSIYTINYDKLKENGIKCLLFDLDNTCVPYVDKKPTKKLKNHFDKLKDSGFTVIIFSNSPRNRLEPFKKYLNVDCCPSARKPRKAKFIKVLKEYKLDLSEVAIIGDQLVTDIYGGNRVGITTVLVNPMSDIDMPFTKIHRYIERKEINKMNKKGIFKVGEYYD